MTVDLVSALVRIERREETAEDRAAVIAAVTAVGEAERVRIEQDHAASEDDVRVARAFAGPTFPSPSPRVACSRLPPRGAASTRPRAPASCSPATSSPPTSWSRSCPSSTGLTPARSIGSWRAPGLSSAISTAPPWRRTPWRARRHIGYRDIGEVLGTRGDSAGFLSRWKTYAASKDRHDMWPEKAPTRGCGGPAQRLAGRARGVRRQAHRPRLPAYGPPELPWPIWRRPSPASRPGRSATRTGCSCWSTRSWPSPLTRPRPTTRGCRACSTRSSPWTRRRRGTR